MSFIKKTKLIKYFISRDKLINEFEYDIDAYYLSSPGSNIDTYKNYKNEINNNLEDEESVNLEDKEKNEIDEYKKNVLIKLKNEILKEYEIKYIYMNIAHRTTDSCLKITLNDNCKINAYKLFYLHSLAYYMQDGDDIDGNLVHNGIITIKVYNNYIICDCDTDS